MKNLKVIAEIANAHQGDIGNLKSLVIAAAESGADAVKFQWFKYDHMATPDFEWYQAYKELFIPENACYEVLDLAKTNGLEVWVDVIDEWGLALCQKLKDQIDGLKLPPTVLQSREIAHSLFQLGKPVLIGVGGWYDEEIDAVILDCKEKFRSEIILMHGFQGYPTKTEDASLARISYLRTRYDLSVGFADHEDASDALALELPLYAYFAGAEVIEKHITLDRSLKGYDYYSSLEPSEFSLMVSKLRNAQTIMGTDGVNEAQRSYLKAAGRIVANKKISQGTVVTMKDTSFKRCPEEKAMMPLEAEAILPAVALTDCEVNQPMLKENFRKLKTVIAVICRLKSTRLPKKALLPINGVASVERCLLNCLAVKGVDEVILATSNLPEDDPLEAITLDGRIKVLRGDPDNVARRMLQAAEATNADIILRITGDNPAVSPEIAELLIKEHLNSGADFTKQAGTHAIGTGSDVYTVESIKRLLTYDGLTHTEYLSFYFQNNPKLFVSNLVELPEEFQKPWRLTLDEPKDLEMFEAIYKGMDVGYEPLYFRELSEFLSGHPEIAAINKDVILQFRDNQSLVDEINKATVLL